jgi:hypothetical protein
VSKSPLLVQGAHMCLEIFCRGTFELPDGKAPLEVSMSCLSDLTFLREVKNAISGTAVRARGEREAAARVGAFSSLSQVEPFMQQVSHELSCLRRDGKLLIHAPAKLVAHGQVCIRAQGEVGGRVRLPGLQGGWQQEAACISGQL